MSLPTTFAHKPVFDAGGVRLRGVLQPACSVTIELPEGDIDTEEGMSRLAAAEMVLLDAMGLQTFSRFICVTFWRSGPHLRIDAWRPTTAQELQAA